MRYVLIAVLVTVKIIAGDPEWFLDEPFLGRMLGYSFLHASWWHLAVNCLSLWIIFDPKRPRNTSALIQSFAIAVLVYPVATRPILGISNLLYAAIGLRTPPVNSRWWRTPGVLLFLGITVAMLPFKQIAGLTHIVAFILAVMIACLKRYFKRIIDDARRVKAL